jgi:hypothetical protein
MGFEPRIQLRGEAAAPEFKFRNFQTLNLKP